MLSALSSELSILAHYEYSPFGETIVATGELAKENPYRFSTKYTDDETKLVYYGYRYFSPSMGRFISNDPLMDPGSPVVMGIKEQMLDMLDIYAGIYTTLMLDKKVSDDARILALLKLIDTGEMADSLTRNDPVFWLSLAGNHWLVFCGNNGVMFVDPWGLFLEDVDVYGAMSDMATAGYNRGGTMGSVQANFYSGITALLDVIGGQGVGCTASKSGSAAGEGRTGAAVAWGAGSGALVVMNATTFGRGASAIKNAGKWAANPIKYEVGSGLLPKRIFSQISHLSPVQRGEYLLSNYNSLQRAGLSLWGLTEPTSVATALWGGPTTGGLLGALGLNVYNQYNQEDDCK